MCMPVVPRRFDIDYPAELQKIRGGRLFVRRVWQEVKSILAVRELLFLFVDMLATKSPGKPASGVFAEEQQN